MQPVLNMADWLAALSNVNALSADPEHWQDDNRCAQHWLPDLETVASTPDSPNAKLGRPVYDLFGVAGSGLTDTKRSDL
jgi:hypothetical protein